MNKLDLSDLLKKIRKSEKEDILNDGPRVAVLGSCSIQYFVKILRYYLRQAGLNCEIYEGEYSGIKMDVLDNKSPFYQFNPDYVIILPYHEDIKNFPHLLADNEIIKQCITEVETFYKDLWKNISQIEKVRILQCNYVIPPIRILGNLEYQEDYSKNSFLAALNKMLVEQSSANVTVVDIDALACNIGKYNWFDYPAYFLNKTFVRLDYMPECVMTFAKQIQIMQGQTKKCLVLDLDNTLWGGVIGDDGLEGIQLDPNNAIGEAYRFFQSYCLELRKRGVILAVCSKNDEAVAKEAFERNENMILHLDDISCFVANWDNKADNLRKIAHDLNIGIDSLVFFDDNPAEREIVKQFLKDVQVIDVPVDPALYVLQMEKEQPFEWLQLTQEDLERTDSYKSNQKREHLQESYVDYDEYLKALDMKGETSLVKQSEISRFAQLINKSNQFNLRTIRYTESEIQNMQREDNVRCLYGKLSDRYGNYGLITCVILRKLDDVCFIDTWVMSCRVLKRGVEYMMFDIILKFAKEWKCTSIQAEYIKTKKNHMVESFYESLGFDLLQADINGDAFKKKYSLDNLNLNIPYHIIMEKKND